MDAILLQIFATEQSEHIERIRALVDSLPTLEPEVRAPAFDELLRELDRGLVNAPVDRIQELDLALARGHLRADQIERRTGHLRLNPCWYTGEVAFGIASLFLRDYAPVQVRLGHIQNGLGSIRSGPLDIS